MRRGLRTQAYYQKQEKLRKPSLRAKSLPPSRTQASKDVVSEKYPALPERPVPATAERQGERQPLNSWIKSRTE